METGKKKRVLFSDLDGTLIQTLSGKEFPLGCFDMQPRFDTLQAIQNFRPDIVVIISNQGGIEKGYVNDIFFKNKIQWCTSIVAECCGCDCVYDYCPTCDPNNVMRKPNIGMIDRYKAYAKANHEECEYRMIGDRDEDEQCAKNAGIEYLHVDKFIEQFSS